ncbi:hypothetical protein KAW08_03925 [bacterium]|nr:hypothetical protein [bacterium]
MLVRVQPGELSKSHWVPRERNYGEIIPSARFFGTGHFKGHSVLASFYVETFSENIDFSGFTKTEDLLEGTINKNETVEVPSFSVKVIIVEE